MNKTGKPKFFYGYIMIVVVAFLSMTLTFGAWYCFGVFFKPLLAEFGWTRAMTSGAQSLAVLLCGIFSVVIGRLNDKFGPRIIMTVGGFFTGLGYLLMSQISAAWHLYLFYGVLIAIGASGAYVPLISTVARWFVKRRGLMTGVVISGMGLGQMIMPPLASWLIITYGWRNSYIILGIVILVLITTIAQFLRRDPGQIGMTPYGMSEVKGQDLGSRVPEFSPQQLLRNRQFWVLFSLFLCFGFSISSILVHIVPHATDLGISATMAASILAIIGGASIIGRLMLGSASDRIGNKLALIIGFVVMILALSWLQLAKEVWMFYLFAVAYGFAYGGLQTLTSPMVAELFGMGSHGAIFGIVTLGIATGESMGPVTAGRIFDITGSYQLGFLVIAILSFIGLILVSILRPTSGQGERSAPERSTGLY